MNELTSAQRRELRARAHGLHPVVSISQHGLTPAVLAEIDRSLTAHELIKIRVYGEERDVRETLLAAVCEASGAAAVQHIGSILVVYRENPPPETPEQAPPSPAKRSNPPRAAPRTSGNPRRRLAGKKP